MKKSNTKFEVGDIVHHQYDSRRLGTVAAILPVTLYSSRVRYRVTWGRQYDDFEIPDFGVYYSYELDKVNALDAVVYKHIND